MQHPGDTDVVYELELSGRQRRQVQPRDGSPQHGPLARILPHRPAIEPNIELPPADQLAIANTPGWIGAHADHALVDRELTYRDAETVRRQPEEHGARRDGGEGQISSIEIRGVGLAP